MAVTSGFYNSINRDRLYNADHMSRLFDGIINDGVYMSVLRHFAVRAGEGMNVIVGGGRAWFNHTWTFNDSDYIMHVDDAEFEATRMDAIAIKVNRSDAGRINTLEYIKGIPSEHPEKPTMEDTGDIYYHPLAFITIEAGTTEITNSMIENAIGVDPRTPFVTGIIEHVTADELIPQWQAEWDEWNDEHRQAYLDWVAQQEADMEEWTSDTQDDYEQWIADQKEIYDAWYSSRREQFNEWFADLHYILDGDVAGHLQNEIDENAELEFNRYYELCTKNTTISRDALGSVTSIDSTDGYNVSQHTTFTKFNDGNGTRITTTLTSGNDEYTKVVEILGDDITQTYTKNT